MKCVFTSLLKSAVHTNSITTYYRCHRQVQFSSVILAKDRGLKKKIMFMEKVDETGNDIIIHMIGKVQDPIHFIM